MDRKKTKTFNQNFIKMKKNVLLVAAIFTAAFFATEVQAQDYKPAAGEKTVEVNFTPFGGSPINISGLKFRSFTSETSAFRLGVNIAYSSTSADPEFQGPDNNADGINDFETIDKNSSLGIQLEPGIEKHFAGTDRLSPYFGGVLTIGYNSSTEKDQEYDLADNKVYEKTTKDGSLDLGLRAVLGADWYFTEKMYLGIEVGYGFLYSSLSDTKTESDVPGSKEIETPRGSNFQIGATFNSALRLGYAF